MAERPDEGQPSSILPTEVVNRAAAAISQAWADHSDAERSAVADRFTRTAGPIAAPGDIDDSPEAALLARVRCRGALSGTVRPTSLLADTGAQPAQEGVLASAATDFDRVVVDGKMRWTMRRDARAGVLRALVGPELAFPSLGEALDDVRSVATDRTGHLLRSIVDRWVNQDPAALAGQLAGLFERSLGQGPGARRDLVQALGWASELTGVTAWLRRAERALRVDALVDSYAPLVAGGIVGRDRELARLREFAELSRDELVLPGATGRDMPMLTVVGVGGVGKSTLIGHFVRPYLHAIRAGRPRVGTVVVDLDRVAFRPDSEVELTYEVARQLACFWPEHADAFEKAVADSRRGRLERFEFYRGSSADQETGGRAGRQLTYQLGEIVRRSPRTSQTVLLVLDTFEEWQRERPRPDEPWKFLHDPEAQMVEWLTALRDQMGLNDLRVVVSGRAPVSDWRGCAALPPIQLGDLAPANAAQLLRSALRDGGADDPELTDRFLDQLIAIIGCNPLTVRIAARFTARLDPDERRRFVAEGGVAGSEQLNAEVRRAVLYDRFLEHVRDDDVRKLAHPGLALRRVTPELVERVLAEPCGLTGVDAARAADLVERLASEVWLVTREPDGSLRHRPDVRRAMIQLMRQDGQYAEEMNTVHMAAISWFSSLAPTAQPVSRGVEAVYHLLMIETGAREIDDQLDELADVLPALEQDVDDFAPAVAAQVRLKRGENLTPAQARHLPERHWRTYVEREGELWLHHDPAATADLVLLRGNLAAALDPPWLAQACWDSGRWDAYWRPTDPDLTMDGHRYGFLDAFVAGGSAMTRWQEAAWRTLIEGLFEQDSVADPGFFLLLAMGPAALMRAAGEELLQALRRAVLNIEAPTIDQLRALAVRTALDESGGSASYVGNTPGIFVPDPAALHWVVQSMVDGNRITPMVDEMRTLGDRARLLMPEHADGLRTFDILGGHAQDLRIVLGSEAEFRRADGQAWPDEAAGQVLRGDNPEWRAVVRNELVRNAPDDQWVRTLGEIATALLPVPAVDLRPELQPLLSETTSRTALVTLVEYVDRSRLLGPFLARVSAQHPSSTGLRRLSDAFAAWDQAHWQLFRALREHRIDGV